jgi:hypothetical protein
VVSKHCCQLCHAVFVVEDDVGLRLDLECKYGEGFALAIHNGHKIITSCPLCDYYLSEDERYPLLAWGGLPVPPHQDAEQETL